MNKILELAKKLKQLAEKGIDGEKVNAEQMLIKLMKKHSITLDDLELIEVKMYEFKVTPISKKLFYQVLVSVTNTKTDIFTKRGKPNSVFSELTPLQYIEIKSKFDFYSKAFMDEIDVLRTAFIFKNDIYPSVPRSNNERQAPSPDEVKRLKRAAKIAEVLELNIYHKSLVNDT